MDAGHKAAACSRPLPESLPPYSAGEKSNCILRQLGPELAVAAEFCLNLKAPNPKHGDLRSQGSLSVRSYSSSGPSKEALTEPFVPEPSKPKPMVSIVVPFFG